MRGSCKSAATNGIGVSLVTGLDWLGRKVLKPGPVVYMLAEGQGDLSRRNVAIDHRIEELLRQESGLTRLGAKLEEGNDVLESVLAELRETKARRRVQELTRERLTEEMEDDATRLECSEATIAMIEQTGATQALDFSEGGRHCSTSVCGWRSTRVGTSHPTAG